MKYKKHFKQIRDILSCNTLLTLDDEVIVSKLIKTLIDMNISSEIWIEEFRSDSSIFFTQNDFAWLRNFNQLSPYIKLLIPIEWWDAYITTDEDIKLVYNKAKNQPSDEFRSFVENILIKIKLQE